MRQQSKTDKRSSANRNKSKLRSEPRTEKYKKENIQENRTPLNSKPLIKSSKKKTKVEYSSKSRPANHAKKNRVSNLNPLNRKSRIFSAADVVGGGNDDQSSSEYDSPYKLNSNPL